MKGTEEQIPGQMSLMEYLPKKCECGAEPLLDEVICGIVNGREDGRNKWLINYQCPKCGNVPVDNTGWTVEAHGFYDDALKEAVKNWNECPHMRKRIDQFLGQDIYRNLLKHS